MGTPAEERAGTTWMTRRDGTPQVFYHGTVRDFSRFSKDVEPNFDTAQQRIGFFFSDEPRHAARYAKGPQSKVLCVHLSMSNPKIEPPLPSGLSMIDRIELDWNHDDADAYVERLKAQGYDGIIFEGIDTCPEYVVFDPGQISIVDVMRPKAAQRAREPVQEADEAMSLSM